MAIYFVRLGQNEYKVEIDDNRFKVNGRLLDMKLQQLNDYGLYLIERGKKKLELLVRHAANDQMEVSVDNKEITVQIDRDGSKPLSLKKKVSENELASPLPGVVVRSYSVEGQTVLKGDVLVTIESMKMQMELRASISGKIGKICMQEGDRVEKGQILVTIEP